MFLKRHIQPTLSEIWPSNTPAKATGIALTFHYFIGQGLESRKR
jgi:hypothetical protein